MGPVLCMITPGRAVGVEPAHPLLERIGAAARAGVHLIQVREPALETRALTLLVERVLEATAGTAARVLVNDRLDVALAAGAHGVHLRGDSVPAGRVRAIAPPGFLVGRSVHAVDEAVAAARDGGLDYLIFGTVFPTESKPGVAAAGCEALTRVAAATALPVLAVGGITAARLGEVGQAGAAGAAAIGLFADPAANALQLVVTQASLAFDTP